MGDVSALRWLVQPEVPGCPIPLIERAIAIAAREWCDLTQSVKETVALTSSIGAQSYALALSSAELDIARLSVVSYGATVLPPMLGDTDQAKLDAAGGTPTAFWLEGTTLWFDRVPQSEVSISVKVAVKPKLDAKTLPDALISGEASLGIGARARRELMMTKQSWGDSAMAAWNESEFQRLARNNVDVLGRNGTNAPIRVTLSP